MIVHVEEERSDGRTLYEVEMQGVEIRLGLAQFPYLKAEDFSGRFRFACRPHDEGTISLMEDRPLEAVIWASSMLYALRLYADEGFFQRPW